MNQNWGARSGGGFEDGYFSGSKRGFNAVTSMAGASMTGATTTGASMAGAGANFGTLSSQNGAQFRRGMNDNFPSSSLANQNLGGGRDGFGMNSSGHFSGSDDLARSGLGNSSLPGYQGIFYQGRRIDDLSLVDELSKNKEEEQKMLECGRKNRGKQKCGKGKK